MCVCFILRVFTRVCVCVCPPVQGAKDGQLFNEQNYLQRAAKPAAGQCVTSRPDAEPRLSGWIRTDLFINH